jgi:hypothetical protein
MRRTLRREIRFLRLYAVVSSLVLVLLSTAAFRQSNATGKFDELTVGRINIVDGNGTLRLVISNKDRMHPGVMDGKVIDRPRPSAGFIFFNDEGDEVGGLTYTGGANSGPRRADAGLMFDQLKQDQTIGFSYSENNGRRTAGFQVWDRPDTRLTELIDQLNAANKIQDPAARQKALAAARASAQPGARRLFAGKLPDRSAAVSLADAAGKPRLTLTVDADGNPRIEFLDEQGKVLTRLPK